MMTKRAIATVLFVWIAAALGADATAADKKPAGRSFDDPARWAKVWESEERDEWQQPLVVLGLLAIQRGEIVADLGAGTGYFTRGLSYAVGDEGKVYAVDVEQAMLDHIRAREDMPQRRVETVLAEPDDPKLPEGEIDVVLTVNTWHHIKKRVAYLKKLDRCLSPEGRVVVVDFRAEELPVGPPPKHKLAREQVLEEFEKAGWTLSSESVAFPYQYFLTFYPPRQLERMEVTPAESSD